MKELLEAGVHFGHQTRRWNPKMKEYIFGERNGIHIIDLQKTLKMFREASRFVSDISAQGRTVLFVGTKRQAQEAISEEAKRCGAYFVNHRWLGGTLTNWSTLQKSIKRLKLLKAMTEDGRMVELSKKERARLDREMKHLFQNLEGIENMAQLPKAVPSSSNPKWRNRRPRRTRLTKPASITSTPAPTSSTKSRKATSSRAPKPSS